MTPAFKKLLGILAGFLLIVTMPVKAINGTSEKKYNESIFVISNYSGVDAVLPESNSIQSLLNNGVDGFRFHIEWEKVKNHLVIKEANNKSVLFLDVLDQIKKSLQNNPDKILTLFLDFNVNVNEITGVFEESGLVPFLYIHDNNSGWPSLNEFLRSGKQLVVFSMQEHRTNPDWILYIWNYAVEPYISIMDSPDFIGEFLKGDPKNDLLIYNEFNFQTPSLNEKFRNFNLDQNPYLIEHIKNVWAKTGKTPNFIMLDKYQPNINRVIDYMNSFKTITGTVTYNTQPLSYVSWEGRNSLTGGKYSFPIGPGDNVTLTPRSPGYRFKPESVPFGELTQSKEQHFLALPLEIEEDLEAYYTFDNDTKDISGHKLNGKPVEIRYNKDSIRSMVAFFDNKNHIVLPKAEEFKVRDHDFTVSVWVKIAKFLPNKADYCILGTPTNSYQEGIHLVIRHRKPYFGFYSNDLEGNMIFEEGKWYHIVWRYTKLNGEQAIYVNGRLDSRSLGHPSYKGRENLIIGLAGFSIQSNMFGYIDNLAIWSRALGNEEIWGLSKDVTELLPARSLIYKYRFWIGGLAFIVIVGGLYVYRRKKSGIEIPKSNLALIAHNQNESSQVKNYIQLFGDFKIINKNGEDITLLFTPKLKQLFLVILVYSQRNKNGISTKELTEIVWPNHSYQNAKNSRGVTIRKLRLILEEMDKVEVVFHIDTWAMFFSGLLYCDYIECLKLLEYGNTHDPLFYPAFYQIVKKGEVFKGESHDWLDDFKGYIVNNVVDILIKYIQKFDQEKDIEFILKLSERILIADPVNEDALAYKLKALIKQNNYKVARFSYEKFIATYLEMYGEKYSIAFDKIIEQNSSEKIKKG